MPATTVLWTPFFGRLASTSPLPACSRREPVRRSWRPRFILRGRRAGGWSSRRASIRRATRWIPSPRKRTTTIEQQIRQAPEDWFWVHNRWKTPKPNFLLTHYKRGIYVPPEMSATDLKPFRILIRGSNWLGDSVISMPAVRAIKAGRPDAHITIAAPEKIAAVWKLVPEVDEVIRPNEPFALRRSQADSTAADFRCRDSLSKLLRSRLGNLAGRRAASSRLSRASSSLAIEPNRSRPTSSRAHPRHQVHHYLHIARTARRCER